jgi:Rieske 2Fe-2S family protein
VSGVGLEAALPSHWYRDEAVFGVEKTRLFGREWLAVCREQEVPGPGDHLVLDVLGESVLLLRNRDSELRAFYNVCRHRGARLCRTPGDTGERWGVAATGGITARLIICPYHQWSYDFDGALVAAPHLGSAADFDRRNFHLYPVGVAVWGGFVFVHLTPAEALPLAEQLGGIPQRLARYPLADLGVGATRRYQVAANWKIICENYNECYHCSGVHPELCALVPQFREQGGANLEWERGVPHRAGAYTFTRSGTTARRAFPGLNDDERIRHKGELAYPNLFLSLSSDHAAVFLLLPRSAGRTDIVCHFLFEPQELAKPDFDASDAVEFWDLVNRQDWSVCESVQQGISARVHVRGYHAPMEDFNLDIRRYVTTRIGPYLPG